MSFGLPGGTVFAPAYVDLLIHGDEESPDLQRVPVTEEAATRLTEVSYRLGGWSTVDRMRADFRPVSGVVEAKTSVDVFQGMIEGARRALATQIRSILFMIDSVARQELEKVLTATLAGADPRRYGIEVTESQGLTWPSMKESAGTQRLLEKIQELSVLRKAIGEREAELSRADAAAFMWGLGWLLSGQGMFPGGGAWSYAGQAERDKNDAQRKLTLAIDRYRQALKSAADSYPILPRMAADLDLSDPSDKTARQKAAGAIAIACAQVTAAAQRMLAEAVTRPLPERQGGDEPEQELVLHGSGTHSVWRFPFLISGACQALGLRPGSVGHVAASEVQARISAVEENESSLLAGARTVVPFAVALPGVGQLVAITAMVLTILEIGRQTSTYFRERTEFWALDPDGPLAKGDPEAAGLVWEILWSLPDLFGAVAASKNLIVASRRLIRARAAARNLAARMDEVGDVVTKVIKKSADEAEHDLGKAASVLVKPKDVPPVDVQITKAVDTLVEGGAMAPGAAPAVKPGKPKKPAKSVKATVKPPDQAAVAALLNSPERMTGLLKRIREDLTAQSPTLAAGLDDSVLREISARIAGMPSLAQGSLDAEKGLINVVKGLINERLIRASPLFEETFLAPCRRAAAALDPSRWENVPRFDYASTARATGMVEKSFADAVAFVRGVGPNEGKRLLLGFAEMKNANVDELIRVSGTPGPTYGQLTSLFERLRLGGARLDGEWIVIQDLGFQAPRLGLAPDSPATRVVGYGTEALSQGRLIDLADLQRLNTCVHLLPWTSATPENFSRTMIGEIRAAIKEIQTLPPDP